MIKHRNPDVFFSCNCQHKLTLTFLSWVCYDQLATGRKLGWVR